MTTAHLANDPPVIAVPMSGRRWLTGLTPGSLALRLGLPTGGTVEFLRLRWAGAEATGVTFHDPCILSAPPFDLVRCEATSADGTTAARLEMTVRHGDKRPGAPSGVPPRPTTRGAESSWRFIVRVEEVIDLLDEVHSTVETTPARPTSRGGMTLPVVPTTLLVQTALAPTLERSAGEIEAWFLGSVPVGALVEALDHAADGVIELRLAGRSDPVVLLRSAQRTLTGEV